MPEKDPNTYGLLTYLAFMGMAAWGAAVNYMHKVKKGRRFQWRELAIDIFCAPFVGLIAGLLCVSADLPLFASFAVAGFAGHMGPRALGLIFDRSFAR